ncbi:hypothetical protein T440DRAFT_514069 [Plenodomus tracheiphilus IPT5]|uniref:C3H1-type domain-containing protein n=1 Tax=Plenodomus tracheiphilus IPT5 TaxID=1408161 RepID=A0A6A7BLI4_9PLEO|nr:hypothetical protein T440DRAFT_514069 [Plenodomus tracheiphilus IPT5]
MADFASLDQQMDSFRASDAAREEFIWDIVAKYKQLMHDHQDLRNDFHAEKENRRRYQTMMTEKEHQLDEYQRQFESSPFVMALIDGDGAIFQDALLQTANSDGGSEAASRLYHNIREHVASLYSNSGHWPIMVQVYLSLEKLAVKLARVGLVQGPQELRIFAQRFSVNQPLFSIIDVGHEMLRTFSDNPTCRHIIFGGCHDSGYLNNLEQVKHNATKAARITLLQTTPMFKGFAELTNFQSIRFDDVFRSEPLPDSAVSTVVASWSPKQASIRPLLRSSTNTTNSEASPERTLHASVVSPSPSTTPSTATAGSGETNGDSWATVGKSKAPSTGNISIASTPIATKKTMKKYAYYNKSGERLDLPLPPKDFNAAQSLEARMKKGGKKMCNHWHLGGRCDNGDFCMFQHEPKLTPGELIALRYKARSLACKNRYCENIDCYLGHQCALERDNGYCPFPDNCHLRATHGMDKVKYVRYDRAGNAENSS